MQHYDVILFDVDGTLIDSAPGILNTLEEVFRKMDVDITGVNLRRYLGPPLRKTFAEHFTDPARVEEAAGLYRASYAVKGSHECRVFPGAAEMLRRLKEAGFVLCTATSKPTQVVTPILKEQGLAPYFDFIGGASMDESRDTKTEVVRYVLEQPCVKGKRVLMVGDRNDDMRGAADCGLDAAGALYGYGSRDELEPFHRLTPKPTALWEQVWEKVVSCSLHLPNDCVYFSPDFIICQYILGKLGGCANSGKMLVIIFR